MRRKLYLGLIALAILALGALWYLVRPVQVTLAPPHRGDSAQIVYATGQIEPVHWARVTSLVRDRIISVCDCEGQIVEAGHVLAQLDDQAEQAVLHELELRLDLARTDLDRTRQLSDRNVRSPQDLERAENEVERLEALIAAQKSKLGGYTLRSPIDGRVLREDAEIGEIADAGRVLYWVGEPTPLQIVAEVNEEDVPRIALGQRTLIRADAFPGQTPEARVSSITPKGDPDSRTYRVRFQLPGDTPLMIGMTVEINVITQVTPDALLIPATALQPGNKVFVLRAGRAQLVQVTLGTMGAQDVEVLSGISDKDQIIAPVPANLQDGARVSGAAP